MFRRRRGRDGRRFWGRLLMYETCSPPARPVIQADSDDRTVEDIGFPPCARKKAQNGARGFVVGPAWVMHA